MSSTCQQRPSLRLRSMMPRDRRQQCTDKRKALLATSCTRSLFHFTEWYPRRDADISRMRLQPTPASHKQGVERCLPRVLLNQEISQSLSTSQKYEKEQLMMEAPTHSGCQKDTLYRTSSHP